MLLILCKASSSEDIAGLILLSGSMYASAYLGPKEPISQAISDLQVNIWNTCHKISLCLLDLN